MRHFKLRGAACAALMAGAIFVCAAPSQAVAADDADDNTRSTFFVSAGGNYVPTEEFSSGTPLGFNFGFGARFNRWVSGELEAEWFNEERGHNPFMIGANAKIYPLTGPLQAYGLIGAGGLTLDNEPIGMMRVGAGAEYYVTDTLGIVLETTYLRHFSSSFDLVSVSWGLTFRK